MTVKISTCIDLIMSAQTFLRFTSNSNLIYYILQDYLRYMIMMLLEDNQDIGQDQITAPVLQYSLAGQPPFQLCGGVVKMKDKTINILPNPVGRQPKTSSPARE